MATSVRMFTLRMTAEVIEDLGLSTTVDDAVVQKMEKFLELTASSSPDVETVYHGTVPLVAGAATVSLLALTDTKGGTIATTGKKLRAMFAMPTTGNANALILTEGASNGYKFLGDGWKVSLSSGDALMVYKGANAPDIGASATNIDMSGTLVQSVELLLVFG